MDHEMGAAHKPKRAAGLHARAGKGQLPGFVQRHNGANLEGKSDGLI